MRLAEFDTRSQEVPARVDELPGALPLTREAGVSLPDPRSQVRILLRALVRGDAFSVVSDELHQFAVVNAGSLVRRRSRFNLQRV